MQRFLLLLAAMFFFAASTAQAGPTALGLSATHHGAGLDLGYSDTPSSLVHLQAGGLRNDGQYYGSVDYDLLAPLSKNLAAYAGLGIGDQSARGAYGRLPLGLLATFERFPLSVGLELVPSVRGGRHKDGAKGFLDAGLAIRCQL